MKKIQSILFEKPGEQNTDICIDTVKQYIKEQGMTYVVVASTTGRTALSFCRGLKEKSAKLVIVTHSVGFKEPGKDEFDQDTRKYLIQEGVPIYTGTILTHSLEKSLMDDFHGIYPGYIIANTLRRFGEGTKVAVEIVMEASDAGRGCRSPCRGGNRLWCRYGAAHQGQTFKALPEPGGPGNIGPAKGQKINELLQKTMISVIEDNENEENNIHRNDYSCSPLTPFNTEVCSCSQHRHPG
jgi:hypothetical protein